MLKNYVLVILCLVMSAFLSCPALADTEVNGFAPGWNFFALPAFHMSTLLPGNPLEILHAFDPSGNGSDLADKLYRLDAPTQSSIWWNAGSFGNLVMGEGYWLYVQNGGSSTLSYPSTDLEESDWWISMPKAGLTDIGNPFSYPVDWSDIKVTDGVKVLSIAEAVNSERWLGKFFIGYDPKASRSVSIGDLADDAEISRLDPAKGYRVTSTADNLALIIPARDVAEPVSDVSATVILAEYGDQEKVPITVEITDAETGQIVMRTITYTDADRKLSLSGIECGVYNISFKASHWLRKTVYGVAVN